MKTVLIVDDEKELLDSFASNLSRHADVFKVVTAEHGAKACAILESQPVDLVITDLKMPVMDGFELLAYMSTHFPQILTIVMTAYSKTEEIENTLNKHEVSHYLHKPFDLRELGATIVKELEFGSAGHIQGISLPTFLQLIAMEERTCTLTVESQEESGKLYFIKGDLIDAETGPLTGVEAVYHQVCWDFARIDISPRCPKKINRIHKTVNELLLEGFRHKDELKRAQTNSPELPTDEGRAQNQGPALHSTLTREDIMALEKHLEGLKEVKGFKAAGIMNYTGEMLASLSDDANIDLSLVGATFNDIFRAAHEASKKIGLDTCRETVINTPKGVIIMRCSGVDAKAHFHLIGIVANDGNHALMKMQIEKMVPVVMQELS